MSQIKELSFSRTKQFLAGWDRFYPRNILFSGAQVEISGETMDEYFSIWQSPQKDRTIKSF